MKVLYFFHPSFSGYSTVAQNRILAMDSVGIEVVPRFVILNNSSLDCLHPRILELHKQDDKNCDICIQHVLPHFFYYTSSMKCIGCFEFDQHNIQFTSWFSKLNLMDEIWVANIQAKKLLLDIDIKSKVKVIPHTFDISVFNDKYEKIDLNSIEGTFKFYFIGELHRRKHISALLRAFHTEFLSYEPVSLVLKLNKFGLSQEELSNESKKFCDMIKGGLRLYSDNRVYKSENIIIDYLSDFDILRLHNSCDCFVSASYAESWNIPAFYAMGFGKYPIHTDCGGPSDYIIYGRNGLKVKCYEESVFGVPDQDTFPGLLTSRERWWNVDMIDLMYSLRLAYNMLSDKVKKSQILDNSKNDIKKYSFEKIGNKIMRELDV